VRRSGRVLRRLYAGQLDRRLEHAPACVGVQQPGAELVAEPEVAAAVDPHRLDVEVAARELPVGALERERHVPVRVAQPDVAAHGDRAAAAAGGLERGRDPVHAQQEVLRVLLGAVAVVRHRPELAAARVQHGREALHRLAGERRRDAVERPGADQRAAHGAGSVGLGGQHGATLERRPVRAGGGGRGQRESDEDAGENA
jgi:hypothetical protein